MTKKMSNEIKLLIIGKNSFIGKNLFNFLKKRIILKKITFEQFKKKDNNITQSDVIKDQYMHIEIVGNWYCLTVHT